jgi:hypothetical protein
MRDMMIKPSVRLLIFLLFISNVLVVWGSEKPVFEETPNGLLSDDANKYEIVIEGVEVSEGVAISFWGTTTVPDGNCFYTKLFEDDKLTNWWPVGKCFPVEDAAWHFSVRLGAEGAPEVLETDPAYTLRVWWLGAPTEVVDEFHFDLSPPPKHPDESEG